MPTPTKVPERYWTTCWATLRLRSIKWCTKFGFPYPCGLIRFTIRLPYPCRKTRMVDGWCYHCQPLETRGSGLFRCRQECCENGVLYERSIWCAGGRLRKLVADLCVKDKLSSAGSCGSPNSGPTTFEEALEKAPMPVESRATRGLGDIVEKIIRFMTLGLVEPCAACKTRQALLNRLWPFRRMRPA